MARSNNPRSLSVS
ncbi:hypothetical protein D037_0655A, partial [Vibrio parahaemolyticus IDH02640]